LTPPVPAIVTGEVEARLIALACSTPPPGHARWSLRLLEKHVALLDEIPDLELVSPLVFQHTVLRFGAAPPPPCPRWWRDSRRSGHRPGYVA
jgi:hypothetical protein